MKAVFVITILSGVCLSYVLGITESSCSSALSTCGSRHPAASSTTHCSEKKPFFDCILSNGCARHLTTYKTASEQVSYSKCKGGASAIIMGWTLPIVLFVTGKYISQ